MERLTPQQLVQRHPRAWHMAEAGSWPSVQRHGLLSTSALLDLFEIDGDERDAIESSRRTTMASIKHPRYGSCWIRDNLPINVTVLRRTLVGMTEAEFYRLLNGRVFFWLRRERLQKLLSAKAYRERRHDVLEIDTAALVERYGDVIELSHLNSGAVHAGANYPRGVGTFRRLEDYPWADRLKSNRAEPVVELTVPYAVPDIAEMVVSVTTL
jgi:hypothetical protein